MGGFRRVLGMRGDEIDLNARIFAVADAFDAMTSDRVYRGGRAYEMAAAELDRCAGEQFDPAVVKAFRRVPREEWDELRRLPLARDHGGLIPGTSAAGEREGGELPIIAAQKIQRAVAN